MAIRYSCISLRFTLCDTNMIYKKGKGTHELKAQTAQAILVP